MTKITYLAALFGMLVVLAGGAGVSAKDFDIPKGDLKSALDEYRAQSGEALIVLTEAVKGVRTKGAKGDFAPDVALMHILEGTGFVARRDSSGMIAIVPNPTRAETISSEVAIAEAPATPGAALETVTVTSSKIGGDVQNIPISITALSQEQLTATQTAGGPDLIKQVPNMTFTKTNFSGYSIPASRHRHTSDFCDDRPRGCCRVERHAIHPQSLLRARILRRQSG